MNLQITEKTLKIWHELRDEFKLPAGNISINHNRSYNEDGIQYCHYREFVDLNDTLYYNIADKDDRIKMLQENR